MFEVVGVAVGLECGDEKLAADGDVAVLERLVVVLGGKGAKIRHCEFEDELWQGEHGRVLSMGRGGVLERPPY